MLSVWYLAGAGNGGKHGSILARALAEASHRLPVSTGTLAHNHRGTKTPSTPAAPDAPQRRRAAARALAEAAALAPTLHGPVPLAVAASIPLAAQHRTLGSAPAPGPGLQPKGAPAALDDHTAGIPSSAGPAPGSVDAPDALLAGGQALPKHTPLSARYDGDRPLTIVAEFTEASGDSADATGPGLSNGAIAALVVVLTIVIGLGATAIAWRWGLCTPGLDCARCCGRYAWRQ